MEIKAMPEIVNLSKNDMGTSHFTFGYIKSFDSIRGFAIILVLVHHLVYKYGTGGWIGVDLFFVLSGYLITSLLFKEFTNTGNISLYNFYARRGLRLFPSLILCILLATFLWPYTHVYKSANQALATVAGLFYFSNLIHEQLAGNVSHLWSLSVEEHFYFFWPILVLSFAFKVSIKKRIFFLIVFILLVTLFKLYVNQYPNRWQSEYFVLNPYHFTFCRIDTILIGALMSLVLSEQSKHVKFESNYKNATLFLVLLLVAFGIILVFLPPAAKFWLNGGFIFTNLVCVLTVLIAIKNPNHVFFCNKIIQWFGKRSYGLYVYHFPIALFFQAYRVGHSISNFLIISVAIMLPSLIITELSYSYIEKPILLKYRKRFETGEN